ncbi:serine hydrolase, partial [Salmonella enterica]
DQPGLSLSENLRRLAAAPLTAAPGSGFRYSLGMDVMGGVVESVTGGSLRDAVRKLVTDPLGIVDTGFAVADVERLATNYFNSESVPVRITDGMVVPLDAFNGSLTFAPSRILDPNSYPSGGGGMVGTAGDVLHFLETIRLGGGPILKPETVEMMATDQLGPQAAAWGPGWGFGFGWAVLAD